jgi:subfamily B ATP-binding cassette protein MsbA
MIARILQYLSPYKATLVLAFFCMIVFGATDGVVPFIIKQILDKVFQEQDKNLLFLVIGGLIVFALVRATADFGQQFLMSKIGHLIVRDIRNELNKHLLTLPPGYFVKNSTANLISRTTSDVILMRGLLTDSVASVIRDVIRVITLLISAVYLDPALAGIAVIVLPLGFYPMYSISRKMRKLSRRGQEGIGALTSILQESLMGNRVVKIFGREKFEIQKFENENDRLNRTFVKSEVARALTGPVNEILAAMAIGAVIFYGGYSVINGVRTQGAFIAFLVSVFLLYDPIKKLTRVYTNVQQGLAGAERIFEVLDTQSDIKELSNVESLPSRFDIEFDNVTFRYSTNLSDDSRSENALNSISLHIKEGQKVAIVGFSGAGKSTLIDLLPRFIDPTDGVVKLGGVDIKRLSLSDLRSKIAMVGQHTFLFNDTIYANIAYGRPDATQQQVTNAASMAYALDFIQALPDGFNTVVGEGGLSLSGGERQRIAIARAILKDSPILILDEATASLDNRSEREVQQALESLEKGRTTLVIAHRLSTVQNADVVVVMESGSIAEIGTHDELLRKGGIFTRLHQMQFKSTESVVHS